MSKGFDELLTFPTAFIFRIIANNTETVTETCEDSLKEIFSHIEEVQALPSKSGKFVRIHITVKAQNADQIYAGYDVLKDCEAIKMVF